MKKCKDTAARWKDEENAKTNGLGLERDPPANAGQEPTATRTTRSPSTPAGSPQAKVARITRPNKVSVTIQCLRISLLTDLSACFPRRTPLTRAMRQLPVRVTTPDRRSTRPRKTIRTWSCTRRRAPAARPWTSHAVASQAASVNSARQRNSVAPNPTGEEERERRERERPTERPNRHQKVRVAVVHSKVTRTN